MTVLRPLPHPVQSGQGELTASGRRPCAVPAQSAR
jgi:hypothetical protein